VWKNIAIAVGAFVAATALAELLGAPNLGTAASFGQLAFAAAVLFVIVKR